MILMSTVVFPRAGQLYSIVLSMSKEHVLSAGFDINTPDDFGRTCLHAAASGGSDWNFVTFYSSQLQRKLFCAHMCSLLLALFLFHSFPHHVETLNVSTCS